MFKLNLRECLNNISMYIYDQNIDDKYENTETALVFLMGDLANNRKECAFNNPTDYKVIKRAYTEWNNSGKICEEYEVN